MNALRRIARVCFCALLGLVAVETGAVAGEGKCCLPNGRGCVDTSQQSCANAGGLFVPGEVCDGENDDCHETLGACCVGAVCTRTTQGACAGGTWFSEQACSAELCTPSQGACCVAGVCTVTTQAQCQGLWLLNVPCEARTCSIGVCCNGSDCTPSVLAAGCESGEFIEFGRCGPGFCRGPIGVCCLEDGTCTLNTQEGCEGAFDLFMTSCDPTPCEGVVVTGACCTGTACTVTEGEEACQGSWQGAGSVCDTPENPVLCCRANYDRAGGVQVADIFAFLRAWFAVDERADFDGGNGVQVADIFAYLRAWFAGC